jgi:hypothetical protein
MKPISYVVAMLFFFSFQIKEEGVIVTFKNASGENFKKLEVNILGHQYNFENVKAGGQTKPIRVDKTYQYCYARAITSKDTIVCQPDDFVGEKLYRKGKLIITFFIYPEDYQYRTLSFKNIELSDTAAYKSANIPDDE